MFAWQATVQDESGNAIPLPVVTVWLEDGVTLASIYDEAGNALPNPMTGTIEGFVQFWAESGKYKVEGQFGGQTTEVWDVSINMEISEAVERAETAAAEAEAHADEAEISAAQAAEYDGVRFDDYAALLTDTGMTYAPGQSGTVEAGDFVNLRKEGLAYQVLPSDAPSYDVQTSGGVKIDYASPTVYVDGFGAKGDGSTDDSEAFQKAMDSLPNGGDIVLTKGSVYLVEGLVPRSNVSIRGQNSTIKAPPFASNPIIFYNSATTLTNFNLDGIIFDGSNLEINCIEVTEPSPVAPDKTWNYSVVNNCIIKNSGAIGIYCQIPGRVRIENCYIHHCDIGIAWDREHFDIVETAIEENRIGVRSTGNHFSCVHMTLAHNTEKGWTTSGAGLGVYTSVSEAVFVGCTSIDNPVHYEGPFDGCRFLGNRFLGVDATSEILLTEVSASQITGNYFRNFVTAINVSGNSNTITGNYFRSDQVDRGVGITNTSGNVEFTTITGNSFQYCTGGINFPVGFSRNTVSGNNFFTCDAAITGGAVSYNTISGNKFNVCQIGIEGVSLTGNQITGNGFWGGESGIYTSDLRGHNFISENQFYNNGSVSIDLSTGSVNADTLKVSGNMVVGSGLEAIKVATSGSTIIFSISVQGNNILNSNMDNESGVSCISMGQVRGAIVTGNIVRKSSGGAAYALVQSGGGQDIFLDGNVARGTWSTSNAWKVSPGTTVGTNIGAVDAT